MNIRERFRPVLIPMIGILLACFATAPGAQETNDQTARVSGTIVSLRGNILIIKPNLRPVMTRVAFDKRTDVLSFKRGTQSELKPGMRVMFAAAYSETGGLHPRWIEAAEKPIGSLARKSEGLHIEKDSGTAQGTGTLKSVQPFVVTDDVGKEFTGTLDQLRAVWFDYATDRNSLLIGVKINAEGKKAPDGVIQATVIYPDHGFAKTGTMFGDIIAVQGDRLKIRPRYTSDILTIMQSKGCTLQRQISLDPETIKVGDTVTFWGEHPGAAMKWRQPTDLKAIALLVGPGRYPSAQGEGAPIFVKGKIRSLDPVRLRLADGSEMNILIPAQMPIARLTRLPKTGLKRGQQAMLVLARKPDGGLETSAIILDASPWVGYGN